MNPEIMPTENGAKLVSNQRLTGCYSKIILAVFIIGVLTIVFLVPESNPIKGAIGTFVIILGLIFVAIVSSIMKKRKNKVLITIENGYIKNEKQTVALADITDITYGWHNEKASGGVFEDLIVTTKNNQKYYFSYYNLVTRDAINQLIEEYIIPYASGECKENWENKVEKQD